MINIKKKILISSYALLFAIFHVFLLHRINMYCYLSSYIKILTNFKIHMCTF